MKPQPLNFNHKAAMAALGAAVSFSALADNRIRTETYSKERVYPIYSQVGKAVLIQLEDDEQLKGESSALGMGDSEAWTVGVRGNNIIFKPKAEKPVTNMIVVSNKRTYAFDLKIAGGKYEPTYIMRFRYPDTARKQQQAERDKQNKALQILFGSSTLRLPESGNNTLYYGQGDKKLAPTAMWDNGRFTYLRFNNGRDMPSAYRVEQDGTETLLNTHIEDDTVVIHEVNEKIILRLGRSVLLLENRGYRSQGTFNRSGTDDNQSVRIIK